MKNKCGVIEIIILYIFSLYYIIKEFFYDLFFANCELNGKLFMKCDGKTAIITGGTTGIGLETTRKLLSFGMNVIIGSNLPEEESMSTVEKLRLKYPGCKVEVWYVDMSSLASVKEFSERFLISGMPLHVLINNAGIMFAPYKMTRDGFESHFCINYLSHCLLTILLLPRLQESGGPKSHARIVNVASCLHYLAKADFRDLYSRENYCCHQSYMQSKLFMVMFSISLDRFLKAGNSPVTVNAVHPGVIYTQLYKHIWWAPWFGRLIILRKPIQGAETPVYAALSAKLEISGGKYLEDCTVIKPSKFASDRDNQNRLWNKTMKLVKPWVNADKSEVVCESWFGKDTQTP